MLDFRPQNAKGLTIAEAVAKCGKAAIEPKYDGWRFVVYIDDDGVHVYSRTGIDYTAQTPKAVLADLMVFPVGTILDGEMVDLDNQECTAVTNVFGKSRTPPTQEELNKISYVIFDIVRLGVRPNDGAITRFDGSQAVDVAARPLSERRELIQIVLELRGPLERVVLTTSIPLDSVEHGEQVYTTLVENGYEGAMVKCLNGRYMPGKRGHGWFKIKETNEIDVVVMHVLMDGKGQHEGKAGRWIAGQYIDGILTERAKVNCYDDAMRNGMTADPDSYIMRVATIKHYGVLKDGLRHPTFVRWREDKPAEDCTFHNH